jgi:hypothetical protein
MKYLLMYSFPPSILCTAYDNTLSIFLSPQRPRSGIRRHCRILLREPLGDPLRGLEELVDTAHHTAILL